MKNTSWQQTMKKDVLELSKNVVEAEKEAKNMYDLPSKVECLTYDEATTILRNMIKDVHKKQGKSGTRIMYKNNQWEPSFWPERWPWTQVSN